ncbi:MAG TPA: NUDIX hydrolase [Candidatus Saccharimonadales bacterium]|nr:NUDIX hydrolase [Candidatus Saccharimonadales bacterium]
MQNNKPVLPWKTLSSSMALSEKWFRVRKDVVQLPSGKIVDDYFVWEAPHIVLAIPVTAEGKFVLVKQYRHGIGEIMYQFPAGAVDNGESLAQAARREMEEEAGFVSEKLIHLGTNAPYASKVTSVEDMFLAPDATDRGHRNYDEQEESEVVLLSKDALLELIDSKKIQMAGTLLAATFLALRYLEKTEKDKPA